MDWSRDQLLDELERAERAITECLEEEDRVLCGGPRGAISHAVRSHFPTSPRRMPVSTPISLRSNLMAARTIS